MYYRFHLLVESDDVQQILALPGTDILAVDVCREPRTPGNVLFSSMAFLPTLHIPQYKISYVTMKLFVLFFVVQDILVGLARSFPWP